MKKKAIAFLIASVCFLVPLSIAMNDSTVYRVPEGIVRIGVLSERTAAMTKAKVVRVVDGDTIVVEFAPLVDGFSKREKVRLIGVDTPESVDPRRPVEYYARDAAAHTGELVGGKDVRFAFGSELRDRYGRLLAYVFTEDGTCVNLRIVADGFGFAYTKYPFQFMADFEAAERRARKNKTGLWARSE